MIRMENLKKKGGAKHKHAFWALRRAVKTENE